MPAYSASAVHPWIGPPAGIVLVVCWWLCPTSLIPDPVFLLCCRYQPSAQMHNLKWQSLSESKCECMCTENVNKNLHYSISLIAVCLTPYLFIHWYTGHLMARFLYARILVLVTVFKYCRSTVCITFPNILRKSCMIQIIILLQLLLHLPSEKG